MTKERYRTEYHQVVAGRSLARAAMRFGRRGQLVHVAGSLHGHSWTGADGTKHDGTEIIAESFQVLDQLPNEVSRAYWAPCPSVLAVGSISPQVKARLCDLGSPSH